MEVKSCYGQTVSSQAIIAEEICNVSSAIICTYLSARSYLQHVNGPIFMHQDGWLLHMNNFTPCQPMRWPGDRHTEDDADKGQGPLAER